MTIIRDTQGKWLRGHSGNSHGRPRGARDKRQRTRRSGPQPWAAENLGLHAIVGGPGRPRGDAYWATRNTDMLDARRLIRRHESDGDPEAAREALRLLMKLSERAGSARGGGECVG